MDNGGTDSTLERLFYHTDRVRLVHWHAVSGARTAVVLTGATTVLAFVTGMSILSAAAVTVAGPVAQLVPGIAGFVRFAGVLCAFILGLLTVGLRRRKRLAWYLTVVMLPLTAVVPLTTLRPSDVPLLVLVACTFPLLVINRGQFDRTLDITALQSSALAAFAGALFYGVIGSYAQRSDFVGLETWSDAIYYVIVTIATVGYGDVRPTTTETKWFSLSVIMFGTAAFTVAVGSLIAPAIEKRLSAAFGNMKPSELTLLEDHVIVLGHGDFTESLLDELDDETDVVSILAVKRGREPTVATIVFWGVFLGLVALAAVVTGSEQVLQTAAAVTGTVFAVLAAVAVGGLTLVLRNDGGSDR